MPVPDVVRLFFRHPANFVGATDFHRATAFVQGYDTALQGGLLSGFREWLVVRVNGGNNLGWPRLFLKLAFPFDGNLTDMPPGADEMDVVSYLGEVLEEFFAARDQQDGLRRILIRYTDWLAAQPWHAGEVA